MYKILVINPGSTSTRLAVFLDDKKVLAVEAKHSNDELQKFPTIQDQLDYRKNIIEKILDEQEVDLQDLSAVVGRGGALRPIKGGTYNINKQMLDDCRNAKYSNHPSNLGCQLAVYFSEKFQVPAFVVDPPLIDEFAPVARISGIPGLERRSAFHALNEKFVARMAAKQLNKKYEESNFITVHLGSGISVTAHYRGRCIDNNFGLGGDGPFSPERCNGLPALTLGKEVIRSKLSEKEWEKIFAKKGGVVSYLGTNDIPKLIERIKAGEQYSKDILDGMIFGVAKEIGAYSTVLKGKVDAIIITGAISRSQFIVDKIESKVKFIAPVLNYPGEYEMEALAQGAIRVLKGLEKAIDY